jgi:hypothetical protein
MIIEIKGFKQLSGGEGSHKAIIKPPHLIFEELHQFLVLGCVLNGVDCKLLQEVFDNIEKILVVGLDEQVLVVEFDHIFL